jgi:hypothetical protein
MTRRRYTADQLTPITSDLAPTRRRQNDPTAGHRRETWTAHSTCGTWSYERAEIAGTPWQVRHLPTGYLTDELWSTLDDARHDTAQPSIWGTLGRDALWVLAAYPEVGGGPSSVTAHDEARALLTWLIEHDPAPSRLDPVAITG